LLIAGGSIALSASSSDYVLQFAFNNGTWSTLGDGVGGPVTAITVNDGNASSIFAAGRYVSILLRQLSEILCRCRYSSADGTSSFLAAWNGHVWIQQGSAFGGLSNVSQLAMVPLQNQHSTQGLIEADRVLFVSGSLDIPSYGQVSSMLFDGQSSIPYIVSASTSGNPGSVAGLFNSLANFSFSQRRKSCRSLL
jgi:Cortical protein marker for cell polarity